MARLQTATLDGQKLDADLVTVASASSLETVLNLILLMV